MAWLEQVIGSALQKQQARDSQRALVQTLGQAVMQDDQVLDDPAYLKTNPTLAAILGEGADTQQQSSLQMPTMDQLGQALGPLLQGIGGATAPIGMLPMGLAQLFSQGQMPQETAVADPLRDAVSGTPMPQNNASAIASQLQPAVAPPAAEVSGGFMDFLKDPKVFELLLQTSLGLARGEEFGQALTGGVQGMRQLDINARNTAMAERKAQREDQLAGAEITERLAKAKNLNAESTKIANELRKGKDSITSNQYATGLADMYKHVTSDIFTIQDIRDGKSFNDAETLSRYLWNSSLKPEERVYSPLKQTYINKMGTLVQEVQAGNVDQAELKSRVDEYKVAFGPTETAKMLKQLQGTTQ